MNQREITYEEALNSIKYELFEEGHCTYIEEELKLAIKALEKQIKKKPKIDKFYITCPVCGDIRDYIYDFNFCENCGQKLLLEE